MNENDSERLAGLLVESGMTPAEQAEEADLLIVNSCSVRAKSEEKLFSLLGRLASWKKKKPFRLAVIGCTAQLHGPKILERIPDVDFVLGPDNEHLLPGLLAEGIPTAVAVEHGESWREQDRNRPLRDSAVSAYVTIMEGCDNFCAYCVVPFSRGREKYRPFGAVLDEILDLLGRGYKEIILLGQNVNSYSDPKTGLDLAGLIRRAGRLPGMGWLRFLTSHPKNFTSDLIRAMAETPSVCRELHLPLQSGSTAVLEKMNRGYSREDYLRLVGELRSALPGLELSTDIIVGFPGEREQDFRETLDLLERIRFANIFSFRYSPRPGTAASRLEDDIPLDTKISRLIELQARQKDIQLEKNRAMVGTTRRILCTGRSKKGTSLFCGRDESHRTVNFTWTSGGVPLHRFVEVRITGCGPYPLLGEALTESESAPSL